MGDISTRGKGKTLKMKKGGALPSNKGASKAGMQSKQGRNFLLPKTKPKKPKLKDLLPPRRKKDFERGTPLPRGVETPDILDKFLKRRKKLSGLDKIARDLKPTGRLSTDDLRRVRNMLNKRKAK